MIHYGCQLGSVIIYHIFMNVYNVPLFFMEPWLNMEYLVLKCEVGDNLALALT